MLSSEIESKTMFLGLETTEPHISTVFHVNLHEQPECRGSIERIIVRLTTISMSNMMHSIAHTILYPILAAIIFVSMSIYVHISLFHSTEGLSLITSITFSSTAAVYAADHVVDIFDGDWIIILPGITLMAICFIDLIYQIVFQIPVFALPFNLVVQY